MAKRLLLMVCLAAFGACALDKQTIPGLTGPSGLALSLDVRATPDVLLRDGVSQSVILITAKDADGNPVSGLTLYFASQINLGSLSAASGSTNSAGNAAVTFTAPSVGNDTTTTLTITPVGANHQNTLARTVSIRLVRPPA